MLAHPLDDLPQLCRLERSKLSNPPPPPVGMRPRLSFGAFQIAKMLTATPNFDRIDTTIREVVGFADHVRTPDGWNGDRSPGGDEGMRNRFRQGISPTEFHPPHQTKTIARRRGTSKIGAETASDRAHTSSSDDASVTRAAAGTTQIHVGKPAGGQKAPISRHGTSPDAAAPACSTNRRSCMSGHLASSPVRLHRRTLPVTTHSLRAVPATAHRVKPRFANARQRPRSSPRPSST